MHCVGLTLVGQLEVGQACVQEPPWGDVRLVWARALVFANAAGWLECWDLEPICAIKVKDECKQWYSLAPLSLEKVPAVPSLLNALGLVHW